MTETPSSPLKKGAEASCTKESYLNEGSDRRKCIHIKVQQSTNHNDDQGARGAHPKQFHYNDTLMTPRPQDSAKNTAVDYLLWLPSTPRTGQVVADAKTATALSWRWSLSTDSTAATDTGIATKHILLSWMSPFSITD
jgi:hypothetical protein